MGPAAVRWPSDERSPTRGTRPLKHVQQRIRSVELPLPAPQYVTPRISYEGESHLVGLAHASAAGGHAIIRFVPAEGITVTPRPGAWRLRDESVRFVGRLVMHDRYQVHVSNCRRSSAHETMTFAAVTGDGLVTSTPKMLPWRLLSRRVDSSPAGQDEQSGGRGTHGVPPRTPRSLIRARAAPRGHHPPPCRRGRSRRAPDSPQRARPATRLSNATGRDGSARPDALSWRRPLPRGSVGRLGPGGPTRGLLRPLMRALNELQRLDHAWGRQRRACSTPALRLYVDDVARSSCAS